MYVFAHIKTVLLRNLCLIVVLVAAVLPVSTAAPVLAQTNCFDCWEYVFPYPIANFWQEGQQGPIVFYPAVGATPFLAGTYDVIVELGVSSPSTCTVSVKMIGDGGVQLLSVTAPQSSVLANPPVQPIQVFERVTVAFNAEFYYSMDSIDVFGVAGCVVVDDPHAVRILVQKVESTTPTLTPTSNEIDITLTPTPTYIPATAGCTNYPVTTDAGYTPSPAIVVTSADAIVRYLDDGGSPGLQVRMDYFAPGPNGNSVYFDTTSVGAEYELVESGRHIAFILYGVASGNVTMQVCPIPTRVPNMVPDPGECVRYQLLGHHPFVLEPDGFQFPYGSTVEYISRSGGYVGGVVQVFFLTPANTINLALGETTPEIAAPLRYQLQINPSEAEMLTATVVVEICALPPDATATATATRTATALALTRTATATRTATPTSYPTRTQTATQVAAECYEYMVNQSFTLSLVGAWLLWADDGPLTLTRVMTIELTIPLPAWPNASGLPIPAAPNDRPIEVVVTGTATLVVCPDPTPPLPIASFTPTATATGTPTGTATGTPTRTPRPGQVTLEWAALDVQCSEASRTCVAELILTAPLTFALAVDVVAAPLPGEAAPGRDYGALSGPGLSGATVTFDAGDMAELITMPLLDDTYIEPEEQLALVMSAVRPLIATRPMSPRLAAPLRQIPVPVLLGAARLVMKILDNELPLTPGCVLQEIAGGAIKEVLLQGQTRLFDAGQQLVLDLVDRLPAGPLVGEIIDLVPAGVIPDWRAAATGLLIEPAIAHIRNISPEVAQLITCADGSVPTITRTFAPSLANTAAAILCDAEPCNAFVDVRDAFATTFTPNNFTAPEDCVAAAATIFTAPTGAVVPVRPGDVGEAFCGVVESTSPMRSTLRFLSGGLLVGVLFLWLWFLPRRLSGGG